MKSKILFSVIAILITITATAQTNGILYKSGQWLDIKGNKGSWAAAMKNPTYEKVEILVTEKYIKATFGSKVYNYTVVSSKRFSATKMDYTVTLNGKTYELTVGDMTEINGTYMINISGVWMVSDIRDVKTVDVK